MEVEKGTWDKRAKKKWRAREREEGEDTGDGRGCKFHANQYSEQIGNTREVPVEHASNR